MSIKASSFNVYNASAGSGKTFTLVKAYLTLLLSSKQSDLYRNILALTFTNKAVGEMKTRIIDSLKQFSDDSILTEPNSMFRIIADELDATPKDLQLASKKLLQSILHNYAAFDISTIDRFTHKVIRTFAFDLKIPVNFEVELDTENLLSEAVDNLISKAGIDKALTTVLVDFAIEKTDEDKSWDISNDFNRVAKLLVNENEVPFIELLKNKTLEDFDRLKNTLLSRMKACEEDIVLNAKDCLKLIEDSGLQYDDFSRSSLPKHFESLAKSRFTVRYDSNWQDLEGTTLYPSRVSDDIATTINSIKPQLIVFFSETKDLVFQYRFYQNFYKNLTPLSVLNAINRELQLIKEENNLLLISEFNKTIHDEIKDQPTPFIYERLGEKYRHYFIDEFQDTSHLQWQNLIPLIDNRLSSEIGSAMLVGDAKQAIYRWRGGKPEIFIDLVNDVNPFNIDKSVHNLPTNYRSCRSVVEFNNGFFEHLVSFAFSNDIHARLYKSTAQKDYIKEDGFVNLEFLEFEQGDDRDERYPEAVKQTIDQAISNGFELRDICVLTRKKKEGIAVANFLNEHDIDIISSETLLIERSPKVRFVNNLLRLATQPENKELKADLLYFIAHQSGLQDEHDFIKKGMDQSFDELTWTLSELDIRFNMNGLLQLSLYDAAEYIVRAFGLVTASDAYIQFYLDAVLDFSQKKSSSILDFLSHWETKKDSLSITVPNGKNAVQIMTIHKSKGLEFPVVIFPYADLNIYKERDPRMWYPIPPEPYNGFTHALLNYNKDLEEFGGVGKLLYDQHQSELELDNINLLYVTLTRAVEQLHIISKKDRNPKGSPNLKEYSGLFISYLESIGKWSDTETTFSFGNPVRQMNHATDISESVVSGLYVSNKNPVNIVTNAGYLWDTDQEKAIERGNLVHEVLSRVHTDVDIEFVIEEAFTEGLINKTQKKDLEQVLRVIVGHPELERYYSNNVLIYNERDIISSNGAIIRPDRLVIDSDNKATIIDYKTGAYSKGHAQQLMTYADIITTMGIGIDKKLLVYINDEISIKEV